MCIVHFANLCSHAAHEHDNEDKSENVDPHTTPLNVSFGFIHTFILLVFSDYSPYHWMHFEGERLEKYTFTMTLAEK